MLNAEVKTADVNGICMRYAVFGQGSRQMVILPGLSIKEVTDSAEAVAASYACFSGNFTIYIFDRRLDPPMNYTIRQMAADTAEVMRALGISSACVFGVSQGGMIAQYLAIDAPELVSKLALASSCCEMDEMTHKVLERWICLAEEGKAEELIRNSVERIYSANTYRLYGETIIDSFGTLSQEELERFSLCARAAMDLEIKELLSGIICPVLVVGAEGDRIIPADRIRGLAEKLRAECYMYDESYGHGVYDEAPDLKERLLAFFLHD